VKLVTLQLRIVDNIPERKPIGSKKNGEKWVASEDRDKDGNEKEKQRLLKVSFGE